MGGMDRSLLSEGLLERFIAYRRNHCGVGASSVEGQRLWLRRLFSFLRSRRIVNTRGIPVSLLDAFLLKASMGISSSTLNVATGTLRQFLRFLFQENLLKRPLAETMARPRRFREELRPKYIPWSKVEELLRGVDRRTILGKRSFAIITLMAFQGLRAMEVGRLRLEDIRWESGSVFIRRRKTGGPIHLPLASITLEALKDYLSVRPPVDFPEVFVTIPRPFRPVIETACCIARRDIQRAFGDQVVTPGSYTLRHSFAKMLLDHGAPIAQIGQLMGHSRINSTLVYLRVATEDLREVANNYADLL